jgi:hypothetical protein
VHAQIHSGWWWRRETVFVARFRQSSYMKRSDGCSVWHWVMVKRDKFCREIDKLVSNMKRSIICAECTGWSEKKQWVMNWTLWHNVCSTKEILQCKGIDWAVHRYWMWIFALILHGFAIMAFPTVPIETLHNRM